MSNLIKVFEIPEEVRKQYAKFTSLELYDDKIIGKGSKAGDFVWFFKSYMTIQWTPASLATQFAQLIFITPENADRFVSTSNLNSAVDVNRIMFCSGMFSYAKANNYVKELHSEIMEAFNNFKTKEDSSQKEDSTQSTCSVADEIKKYKDLLDSGAITDEEFEKAKKKLLNM